jgi:hypothetical protein
MLLFRACQTPPEQIAKWQIGLDLNQCRPSRFARWSRKWIRQPPPP